MKLTCPRCRGLLAHEDGFEQCVECAHTYFESHGLIDLRVDRAARAPEPLGPGELERALAELDSGADFRATLEELLLELSPERSNRLMLLHGEGRGSWHAALRTPGGTALWIGNALSGSWLALALAGFEVTVFDASLERARFAAHRATAQAHGRARVVVAGDGTFLPFADQSFDVVVQEEGLRGGADARVAHDVAECLRIAGSEFFLTAENRLAYKRSTGRRADFAVPKPLDWLREAVSPSGGERTLAGYRSSLAADGFERTRAFALYPHMRDFTHVVSLDEEVPDLPLGPMEKKNRVKLLGHALGLFPVFAPSFALTTARRDKVRRESRLRVVLAALSERLDEPLPEPEHWTATRGNAAVVLTRVPGRREDDPHGRWALHLPMNDKERRELERHDAMLRLVRECFPNFPVPEPLFRGELEGLFLTCERRLPGLMATQLSGDRECGARMLADASKHLRDLVMEERSPLGEADLARLIDARFELVASRARIPSTLEYLERTRLEVRETLRGLAVPRVFYHSDIRSKHVRVTEDGRIHGYLDLGCAEERDLPYFDLLHLITHERKHERDLLPGEAWRLLVDRSNWRDYERDALSGYADALELPEAYCRAIEALYPVLVAAMAEKNWDYSRPRWLHEQFRV